MLYTYKKLLNHLSNVTSVSYDISDQSILDFIERNIFHDIVEIMKTEMVFHGMFDIREFGLTLGCMDIRNQNLKIAYRLNGIPNIRIMKIKNIIEYFEKNLETIVPNTLNYILYKDFGGKRRKIAIGTFEQKKVEEVPSDIILKCHWTWD